VATPCDVDRHAARTDRVPWSPTGRPTGVVVLRGPTIDDESGQRRPGARGAKGPTDRPTGPPCFSRSNRLAMLTNRPKRFFSSRRLAFSARTAATSTLSVDESDTLNTVRATDN